MAKQKTMLDHMIENLTPGQIAELTDVAQDRFPDVAATFAQRAPNKRQTWIIGLMAEHTWRRKVPYKEFSDAFRVGALTDTYGDSRCLQSLRSNLDVCCPGWKTIRDNDDLYIHFPSLDDVRASCEKVFGKTSWPNTDELAMIPIRLAEAEETAEKEKQKAHGAAQVRFAMEWRDANLPTQQIVTAKQRQLDYIYRENREDREAQEQARNDLAQAKNNHEAAVKQADIRNREQRRRLNEGEEQLEAADSLSGRDLKTGKLSA